MGALTKYLKALEKHEAKFDDFLTGKVSIDRERLKRPPKNALEAAEDVILAIEAEAVVEEAEEIIAAAQRPKKKPISFGELERELEGLIDRDNKTKSEELSSKNPFMLWAYASRRGMVVKIDSMGEASLWWDWLTTLCTDAFLHIWGSDPLNAKCKRCKGSDQPLYFGRPPKDVNESLAMESIIRKLPGKYLGYKVTVRALRRCYENRNALIKLKKEEDDIFKGGKREYSVLLAGAIARNLVKGIII